MSPPLSPSGGVQIAPASTLPRRMFAVAANDRADVAAGYESTFPLRAIDLCAPTARSAALPGLARLCRRGRRTSSDALAAPGVLYSACGPP
jgi:hypothetical protein